MDTKKRSVHNLHISPLHNIHNIFIEILAQKIRESPVHNSHLYHLLRFARKKRSCDKIITRFAGVVENERKKHIINNMRCAMVRYRWDLDEYFLFNYEDSTHEERLNFVPEYDKNVFCDMVNDSKQAAILGNKWETYKVYKEFFKRDAIFVRGLADMDSNMVNEFVDKHHNFIIKPFKGSLGKGIQVIRACDAKDAKIKLKDVLQITDTAFIVEELIEQVDEMAEFHENSVNTVRVPTFNVKGEIRVVRPFMRTGRGGSIVDNAGSGGIFAVIDVNTGVTLAAADENNNSYVVHPDSHKKMIGFTVPCWDEAIDTAKRLAHVLPDVKYVGWDLALTDKGWVLVEGNSKGQFLFQYPKHEGFKNELDELVKQMI